MISTTTDTINLRPDQLVTLLEKPIYLRDKYGSLFNAITDSFNVEEGIIELYTHDDALIVYMEDASIRGCYLTLMLNNGEYEDFTILGMLDGKDLL